MLESPVPILYAIAVLAVLFSLGHAFATRRHLRGRRHFRALHRALWALVFLLLAALGAGLATSLLGYKRLTTEAPVAAVSARQIAPQDFAVRVDFPDGFHTSAELRGDEWQLDARVVKWTPRAVMLGAQPLYRVERLSGRYRDAAQAQATTPTVVELGADSALDLWRIKQRFPQWLPWVDADYGSGTYLPLLDGARYNVSLSAVGGLIARPADATTVDKLKAAGW